MGGCRSLSVNSFTRSRSLSVNPFARRRSLSVGPSARSRSLSVDSSTRKRSLSVGPSSKILTGASLQFGLRRHRAHNILWVLILLACIAAFFSDCANNNFLNIPPAPGCSWAVANIGKNSCVVCYDRSS